MKIRRFRINPNRCYTIHVADKEKNLIATIRDNGYYNMSQIFNDVANKCMGSPQVPKYVNIICEETEEWGMYTINEKKLL